MSETMANHSTEFEAPEGSMMLTNAILLYQGTPLQQREEYMVPPRAAPTFATIHTVEHLDGRPTIAAGTPLSQAHLRQWTAALGRSSAPEILPANVIVAHPDLLAWWVPEQVRTAYFNLTLPPEGAKALAQRTTVQLPYPAHLLVATRAGLGVYALPTSERPSAETVILYSPVLNVYTSGQLCWGNIRKPKGLAAAMMAEFEQAVFDSWSTHPNLGQEATVTGKGGLVRLWDNLAARKAKRFPVKRLKLFRPAGQGQGAEPVTLGKLIAGAYR
jgi:PRTRC genetic system protein B